MQETTTKEKILKSVRNALINKSDGMTKSVDFSSPVFQPLTEEPEIEFATRLTNSQGTFVYCENEKALAENLVRFCQTNQLPDLNTADPFLDQFIEDAGLTIRNKENLSAEPLVTITMCEYLVARTGSILVSSQQADMSTLTKSELLIVVAKVSQVVKENKDAYQLIRSKYTGNYPSQLTFITGPFQESDEQQLFPSSPLYCRHLAVFMIDDA